MKRVTIRDLAKLLSISPSTVSRALSDHPDISMETKEKVNDLAQIMNYSVNFHSSSFRNKRSNLIALIVPEVNMFFTPALIEGINEYLESTAYSLMVFISKDKLKREEEIIKQCIHWSVEGVLLSLSEETENIEHLAPLLTAGIKTVIVDRVVENENFPVVTLSNEDSTQKAIEHFIMKGHTDILGIFGNPNLSITKGRINGYKSAFYNNGLPVKEEQIICIHNSKELDSILPVIFNFNSSITAIFTMTDEILSKVLYHMMAMQKKVREDISIISISDGMFPKLVYPNITYIADSGNKMGIKATELLLQLIEGKVPIEQIQMKLPSKLIELNSVKNLKEH